MTFEVRDRVAIVTGGARGFGKEFSTRLLRAGAKGKITVLGLKNILLYELIFYS